MYRSSAHHTGLCFSGHLIRPHSSWCSPSRPGPCRLACSTLAAATAATAAGRGHTANLLTLLLFEQGLRAGLLHSGAVVLDGVREQLYTGDAAVRTGETVKELSRPFKQRDAVVRTV
jgi:hypothetical protein